MSQLDYQTRARGHIDDAERKLYHAGGFDTQTSIYEATVANAHAQIAQALLALASFSAENTEEDKHD